MTDSKLLSYPIAQQIARSLQRALPVRKVRVVRLAEPLDDPNEAAVMDQLKENPGQKPADAQAFDRLLWKGLVQADSPFVRPFAGLSLDVEILEAPATDLPDSLLAWAREQADIDLRAGTLVRVFVRRNFEPVYRAEGVIEALDLLIED